MLNIAPTLEQTFRERAHAHGLTEDQYFAQLLASEPVEPADAFAATPLQPTAPPPTPETREETDKRVRALLTKWQAQDGSPLPTESKTVAELFDQWAAEDANMTEEEVAAELAFWEEYKQDLDERYDRKI